MGVLCGSCEKEYGHLPGGQCEECKHSKEKTAFFIALVALWTLLLLGFTIRSALSSIRDMEEMKVYDGTSSRVLAVPATSTYMQGELDKCKCNHDPMSLWPNTVKTCPMAVTEYI